MAKEDFYTFKSDLKDKNHFTVIVVDKDHVVREDKVYHINGSICDCWAGHKWCRHKQMLVMFKRDNKIDSNEYFNHDKQFWLPKLGGNDG